MIEKMKLILIILFTGYANHIIGQELLPESNPEHEFIYEKIKPVELKNFKQAAEWADLVAIAQVINIDYQKQRDLNAKGQAFLNILVAYKGTRKNDLIIVNEKGFHDNACYYPDRENEGQRFLVFLKKTRNESEYVGIKPLCQIQVLITNNGTYAVRYPFEINFPISQEAIKEMAFADPHATIDVSEWTSIKREQHQKKYASKFHEERNTLRRYYYLTYSQGIDMEVIRKLMQIPIKPRISSRQL